MRDLIEECINTQSYKRVREVFDYDPESGILRRIPGKRSKLTIGKEAGWLTKDGYRRVGFDGKYTLVHRLVWLYYYGEWPKGEIDHKNGIRDDNRIDNLRDVPRMLNQRNNSKRSDNSSNVTGVYWYRRNKKWVAKGRTGEKETYLGIFEEKWDAICARKSWEAANGFTERHGK